MDREKIIDIALIARTSFMTPMKRYEGVSKKANEEVPATIKDMRSFDKDLNIPDYINIPKDF